MFKKTSIYLVRIILLALLFVNGAYAVVLEVGASGGIAVPIGNMYRENGRYLGVSPEIGGNISVNVSSITNVELGVVYHFKHSERSRSVDYFGETNSIMLDGENETVLSVNIGPNFKILRRKISISASGGIGYYRINIGAIVATDGPIFNKTESNTDVPIDAFGFYGGVVFSYTLGKFAINAIPRYHYVFNRGTHAVGEPPLEKDINLRKNDTYLDLLFGLTYELF